MFESLTDTDLLLERGLPILCILLVLIGLRIRLNDVVSDIVGQSKMPGVFLRWLFSILLIVGAALLWLLGPSLIGQHGNELSKIIPQLLQLQQQVEQPKPEKVNLPAPKPGKSTTVLRPKIMAAMDDTVIVEHKGAMLAVRVGELTPEGLMLVAASPSSVEFLDSEAKLLVMKYHDKSGRWQDN